MITSHRTICGILALLSGIAVSPAATNYVSLSGTNNSPYTSWADAATQIQWAVTAAATSNTVLVADGRYVLTNTITINKSITLTSVNGRNATFIDGNYSAPCVNISKSNVVISGFTIMNGVNSGQIGSGYGGGVYISDKNCVLSDCTISNNSASSYGGGVSVIAAGIISNCTISGNGGSPGGGLSLMGGAQAWNCIIAQNTAGGSGGGVSVNGAGCLLQNSYVVSNTAGSDGGGGIRAVNGTVRNCLITRNNASAKGGGIQITGSAFPIQNCTICSNNLYGVGYYNTSATGYFENCIIYSNATSDWYLPSGATVSFTNCCTASTNGLLGSGNITNAPAFVNFTAGDYHLDKYSPCIDAGIFQAWMTGAVDLDGRMRFRYGRVDMGCYERIHSGGIFTAR